MFLFLLIIIEASYLCMLSSNIFKHCNWFEVSKCVLILEIINVLCSSGYDFTLCNRKLTMLPFFVVSAVLNYFEKYNKLLKLLWTSGIVYCRTGLRSCICTKCMLPLLNYVIDQHIEGVWKLTGSQGRPKEVILLKWAVGGARALWHIHVKWSGLLCSGLGWFKPVLSGPACSFTYITMSSPAPPMSLKQVWQLF